MQDDQGKTADPGNLTTISIKIPVTAIGLVLFGTAIGFALILKFSEPKDLIGSIIDLIQTAAVILAAFWAGQAVKVSIQHEQNRSSAAVQAEAERYRREDSFRKKDAALRIAHSFDEVDILALKAWASANHDSAAASQAGWEKFVKSQDQKEQAICAQLLKFMGRLEDMAIAIQHGHADELFMAQSCLSMVKWAKDNFSTYIEYKRQADARYYVEFEKLAQSWADKRFLFEKEQKFPEYA